MDRLFVAGDTSRRSVDPGTLAGLCAIYPRGAAPMACDGGAALFVAADGGQDRLLDVLSRGCGCSVDAPSLAALGLLVLGFSARRVFGRSLRRR